MACGTPVVTSATSAIPEVAGEGAILVDPTDPKAIADALLRLEILTHTPIINKPISMPGVSKEAPETE